MSATNEGGRMRVQALVAGSVALLLFALVVVNSKAQAKTQTFHVGQTYLFVWDCLPGYIAPQGANPCYAERLKIKAVLDDGWLEAEDPDSPKQTWLVYPARAVGITALQVGMRAER